MTKSQKLQATIRKRCAAKERQVRNRVARMRTVLEGVDCVRHLRLRPIGFGLLEGLCGSTVLEGSIAGIDSPVCLDCATDGKPEWRP
jgi:hypothetical protein